MHNTVNELNATELFTLKWLILLRDSHLKKKAKKEKNITVKTQKDKYCRIANIYEIPRAVKFRETESRLVGSGVVRAENEELACNGCSLSGKMRKFWRWMVVMFAQQLNVLRNAYLKWLKWSNFIRILPQ